MLESRLLDDPRVGVIFKMPIVDLPKSGRVIQQTYRNSDTIQPKLRKENRVFVGEEMLEKLLSAQYARFHTLSKKNWYLSSPSLLLSSVRT
jgi:hypothetical protein